MRTSEQNREIQKSQVIQTHRKIIFISSHIIFILLFPPFLKDTKVISHLDERRTKRINFYVNNRNTKTYLFPILSEN